MTLCDVMRLMQVLRADVHNAFAFNGIGCVLAEKGQLPDAQEVFLKACFDKRIIGASP